MAMEPTLKPEVLRAIAEVLGATRDGLTNTEIDRLLKAAAVPDPTPRDPTGMTYVAISKRDRLERALTEQQARDGCSNRVLRFVKESMSPAWFHGAPGRFEALREDLNVALAFAGLVLDEDGGLRRVRKAATLTEACLRGAEAAGDAH